MEPSRDKIRGSGGSRGSYLTGFVMAVALTVFAFVIAMKPGAVAGRVALPCICVAAVVQIAVHLRYFLHLDASAVQRWNVLTLLFTVLLLLLFVGGTIWIMSDLNYRMM